METFQDFLHIMDFNGVQTAQDPHENFSAASQGFTYLFTNMVHCM